MKDITKHDLLDDFEAGLWKLFEEEMLEAMENRLWGLGTSCEPLLKRIKLTQQVRDNLIKESEKIKRREAFK